MRGLSLAFAAALVTTVPAVAAEPVGEWLVKDKVATIRIENCSGSMWGFVAWEKMPGGTDENNPDPSKRNRPVQGLPIILGMKPTGANKWEGRIYNTQDGRIYPANISLADPDTLRVEGCLFGFLCGGENWTRVRATPGRTATRTVPARELCARVADATPSGRR
jgi:uncharacterized protein (DUF2147 family)